MKLFSYILLVLAAILLFSCNYIPFPCNLIPSRENYKIDPIERNDDRFEILRDTIISSRSEFMNDNEIADTDLSYLQFKKPGACIYRKINREEKNGSRTVSKTYLKHTATSSGEKFIETRKVTYTIENENEPSLNDTPEIVKVRKIIHISISFTKEPEQS